MFKPKTEKINEIAKSKQKHIDELMMIFGTSAKIYIDYANVLPWSKKLNWHIDLIRLKQFLDSFDAIQEVNFYHGYIEYDERSEKEIEVVEKQKYIVRTKPVKIMKFGIDASSIPLDSTALLNHFIKRSLLRKYEISTIEYLNERFNDMNQKGEYFIEDRKCNFDVEIGVDMLLENEKNNTETFVLWSGDSDFADPITKLLRAGKCVVLFATEKLCILEGRTTTANLLARNAIRLSILMLTV